MANIVVFGAGLVGRTIAADLAKTHSVTSVDINEENLKSLGETHGVTTLKADVTAKGRVAEIAKDFDLVVGAVPGFLGYEFCRQVIEAGKDLVDISFFPEDAFGLDALAKEKGVTVIVDCGVAPGMSNIILGYHNKHMKVTDFTCFVGGLPFQREYPFEYKAPFSPADVLEEYTRPARYVKAGSLVTLPALSEPEKISFEGIGTLEAFNTDGLRSLIHTMPSIPNMKEKTLRYPGHIEKIELLKSIGLLDTASVHVGNAEIRPIDLTSRLLFDNWKLTEDDEELTVMRVIVEGEVEGVRKKYTYDLFDVYDYDTKQSSMARTTGFTATAAAELVLSGKYKRAGINPPEFLSEDPEVFEAILDYLEDRNVVYEMSEEDA